MPFARFRSCAASSGAGRSNPSWRRQQLAEEGVKEINLISQDTVNYGVDLGLRQGLVSLLRELVKVKHLRWIRPFYLYPQQVTDELLELYAGEETTYKVHRYAITTYQRAVCSNGCIGWATGGDRDD